MENKWHCSMEMSWAWEYRYKRYGERNRRSRAERCFERRRKQRLLFWDVEDVCYPRENIGLYMDIQKKGGIISEFPPGTEPLARNFPMRNRIISGLAEWILVIEAKEKSGSLITADFALDQGKDVYALPGPVTSALSQGCHRLIRQGAGILITPEELMDEWNLNRMQIGQKR